MILPYNTLVVLTGVGLLGASAGMIGAFAVLRKRSLTGDALAHAALPGLCLAFLLVGERNLTALLLGALASGVIGNMVIAALVRWTRVKEDAAIGTVLGGFFGLGVVLLTGIQHMSTAGSKAGLDSYILGKTAGMTATDVYLILGASALCLAVVLVLFKEFKLVAFDGGFAHSLGWPVYGLDLLLMTLVAVAVVIGLPAVGVVLIAALLIMPGAAARFWTDRLDRMLILSCIFGLLIGVIGTAISATYAAMPAGPVIVLTGTSVFAMSALAGTRRGLIAQAIRHWRFRNDLLQRRLAPPELPADGRETSLAKTVSGAWTSIEFADAQSERPQNGRLEAAPVSALSAPPTSALASSAKIPPVSTGRPYVVLAIYLTVVALGALAWFMATIPAADYSLVVGTILTGVVTNASCAILGCYLVLRRMSLLGDAISHSVLPGIALAFVLTGQINGLPIIAGAMVLGIVTSVLSHSLHWFGKVSEDSSLGIVYTTLFAVGVILLQTFASGTHLDADCLIFGQIDTVGLDTVGLAGFTLPRAFVTQITVLAIVLGFVAALWKELKVVSFDPALAAAMGIRVLAVHYALMAMVAGVSVAAFESVGSVLVVAMLVIPAAAAHMMSDRLRHMLAWSVVIGGTSAVIGYLAARQTNTTAAGMMAFVAMLQLAGAAILSPQHGLASRWFRNWQLAVRIAAEDIMGQLYRAEEAAAKGRTDREAEAFLRPQPRTVLQQVAWWNLLRKGFVEKGRAGQAALTPVGRRTARSLVRAHRLWESYLETHFSLPHDHLHEPAERMEHFLNAQLQAELDAEFADRSVDPHGQTIPREEPPANQR